VSCDVGSPTVADNHVQQSIRLQFAKSVNYAMNLLIDVLFTPAAVATNTTSHKLYFQTEISCCSMQYVRAKKLTMLASVRGPGSIERRADVCIP